MYTNLSFEMLFGSISLSGFKYRDRASIIKDILSSINSDPKGKTKTSIMRGANLNLGQVNTYLQYLMLLGVVKSIEPVKDREAARYKLTMRGMDFARDIETWCVTLACSPHRRPT